MQNSTTSSDHLRQGSPQALYTQIRDELRQRIIAGDYAPHERLPSEAELTKAFAVSRITVRHALRELHAEGLIFSVQGKGTFVSKPKAVQNIQRLQGFEESMQDKGYEASAVLVSMTERLPPDAVRSAFGLGPNENTVEIKRVRYLNREPVSVDLSYFPLDVGSRLYGRDVTHDIFTLLENDLGIPLGAADIKLEAVLASDEVMHLLGMDDGEPVLRVERLTFDASGRPIDFEYLSYRGNAFQYQLRIERS
jgi:GntR family transcriptional regulator